MRRGWLAAAILVLLGVYLLLELPWAARWSWSFDSDEAVFGLMAVHIRQGALPFFYYGQSYLGSLSSYVIAGLSLLLGTGPSTVKLSSVLFTGLGYVLITLALARRVGWASILFLALAVMGSQNAHLWTAMQRGPAELVFTIGLVLAVWTWWQDRSTSGRGDSLVSPTILGLTLGFGLWNHLGVGLVVTPLVILHVLAQPWYEEWRSHFSIRGFVTWTDGPRRLTNRLAARLVILAVLLAEAAAIALLLSGGGRLRFEQLPAVIDKLRYVHGLSVTLLLALAWYYVRQVRADPDRPAATFPARCRLLSRSRSGFSVGLLVGVLPGIIGFVARPHRIQVPELTSLNHIAAQAALLVTDSWPRLFGLDDGAAWLLQIFLMASLVAVVVRRRRTWGRIVRLQPCQTGIVDLLCLTMVLDVLAYALGDLVQASAEGYRYLATAPALLAAIAASAIAERSLLAPRVRWLVVATVSLLLVANQWHALGQGALGLPSRTAAQWNRLQQEPSTDSLLASCARLGTNHLWGNYWLSYRLTFLSGETVIVAPADGIDRYPQYTRLVRDDAMRGYVATGGDSMLPVWRRLTGYREWVIGNYHLFTIRRPSDSAPGHGPGSSTRD